MRKSLAWISTAAVVSVTALCGAPAMAKGIRADAVGSTPSTIQLVASSPSTYLTAYQSALQFLTAHVLPDGEVLAGSGLPASANTSAYAAVALAENGAIAPAEAIVSHLCEVEASGGGWNQSLAPSTPPTLGATARVLWSVATVASLVPSSASMPWLPSIVQGANALLNFASTPWGSFTPSNLSSAGSAEDNAIAITALRQVIQLDPNALEAPSWLQAMNRADLALVTDNGVSRVATTDFLAEPLWNLDPSSVSAMRTVGAMFELGFAYQGYGAKIGPGYYSMMDWTNGQSTFNDVIASVHAGLADIAEMQYNYGLTLQNSNGGFGSSAHPPVGPETGSFASGPNASSVSVTAHYLLATDSLLRHGLIGFGWKSATIIENGQQRTMVAPPVASLDPAIPMIHGIRVAVVVSDPSTVISAANPATPSTNEANMELNAAWQLTQLGYNVTLFWYKPNHAEDYYPLADLWPNLSKFQVLVVSDNGFFDSNGYKTAFAANSATIQSWIQNGGRFIDLGDQGPVALPSPLSLPLNPGTVNGIVWRGQFISWPDAANAYYNAADSAFQPLIEGIVNGASEPVAVGLQDQQGRIVLTSLNVASHQQDHLPITITLWNWATVGLKPQTMLLPSPQSYAAAAQSLFQAMQNVYGVPGTGLYRELSNPAAPQRMYSYLWPFTQAMAGVTASAAALGPSVTNNALTSDLSGLSQYYDSALTPPGYESYVATRGGGTAYFDDNGWTTLDLIRAYQDTGSSQFLEDAINDVAFLESGWNQKDTPLGGEYFNESRIDRTQTATGSFLDAVLRLYLITKNPTYLAWAETISTWDRTYMRGLNGIYNDSMSPTGVVGGTPFTYDTGVILQADVLLYRATGNPLYLSRAQQLAVAAINAFVDPLNGVLVENAGSSNAPFNAIFLRGLFMLWETDHNPIWLNVLKTQANMAIQYDQMANGIYGSNWTGVNNPAKPVDLLTQGGTLRLLGMLASANAGQ
jgi:hypothetical protein